MHAPKKTPTEYLTYLKIKSFKKTMAKESMAQETSLTRFQL